MIKTYVKTRYVATCLFTKHSFTDTGPTTGSSNVGCHLGMRYGQDHTFASKEALSTYTFFFLKCAYLTEFSLWTHRTKYIFHSSWVWILNGVAVNFRISEYENIIIRWPFSFHIVNHLVQNTPSKCVLSAATQTSCLEKEFESQG